MDKELQQELYKLVDEILKEYFTHIRALCVGKEKALQEVKDGCPNWTEW